MNHFRFILISFVCLLTGSVFGRKLECEYMSTHTIMWSDHKYCRTRSIDYSAKFETKKHSFSGSASQKSEIKSFHIHDSPQVDFIPLDILSEFPNLNGLAIYWCNLPTLKSGLFKAELNRIELLDLTQNEIEIIELEAFQYLIHLKWISLWFNKIETLPDRLFGNNPDLIYINLEHNQIISIHPIFFDGLKKLKLVDLESNFCIRKEIGCETCEVSQVDLKEELKVCFKNCSKDRSCLN
jgi:Leucine-rich repeat (LRR) protein